MIWWCEKLQQERS